MRPGGVVPPRQQVVDGFVPGGAALAQPVRREARGSAREQRALCSRVGAATRAQIVAALEQAKGESCAGFVNRHGDWGWEAALWLGRLRSAELGQLAGGLDYAVVSKALARFGRRLALDMALSGQLAASENQLSK